ncbi:hypothetical protein [Streptomyces sp. NPDC006012]|uniref:hypothetical protein n=1 Tax=Streptomyces sp. NPDC006012 TaxID=3364739 RepID=UPI00368E43D4
MAQEPDPHDAVSVGPFTAVGPLRSALGCSRSRTALELPAEVLEVLQLPALDALADDRVRGAACLWCGERLTGESAVDLGRRRSPLTGSSSVSGMTWFPRACRACVADRAHRALFDHAPTCEPCVDHAAECELGRTLYRLIRGGYR